MAKYIIYSKCLSNGLECDIDEDTYNNLKQSKEVLFEVRSKENIYNIVLMNYYEFENELFEISLKDEIFQSDYFTFSMYVSKAEQRVLNLLSSITLYLDSFKFEENIEKYSEHVKNEYQSIVDYYEEVRNGDTKIEIIKFLRNHIQHNGLLNPNALFSGVNLSDELREQTLKFEINKKEIKAKWFKLENFTDIEDEIDLKNIIRIHMDFISQIHQKFRELTNEKTKNARSEFESILQKYSEHNFLCVAQKIDGEIKD
ncbi:MAG: hypothetical protein PHE67_08640 [Campylobacterales bacterium]|nr:hypothetical protein [Campylobacterales bacterium]